MGSPKLQGGAYHRSDVTAIIRLRGDLDGAVLLSMAKEVALRYVSQVTGEESTELDEMAQSAVAEMCNVIVGRASRLLEDIGCWVIVAPPAVVLGAGDHGAVRGVQRLVVPVSTPLGEIDVLLVVTAGRAARGPLPAGRLAPS